MAGAKCPDSPDLFATLLTFVKRYVTILLGLGRVTDLSSWNVENLNVKTVSYLAMKISLI